MRHTSFILFLVSLCSLSCLAQQKNGGIPAQEAAAPMSCKIEAKILNIIKAKGADKGSPCYSHACLAKVKILNVSSCGAGVSLQLNTGDTLIIRFAYTLDKSEKIFPKMLTKYPGLKKSNRFTARAEQRLKIGTDGEWVVYGYEKE